MRREIVVFHYMKLIVPVLLVTTLSCGQAPAPAPAEPDTSAHPLQGVWSVTRRTSASGRAVDPAQPGVFIFTEGHYSAVYSLGAAPRPLSAAGFRPTTEEKVAQYDTIIVNTGTYDVNSSTITFRPMVAKSPEFVGGHATMVYEINDDELSLTEQSILAADGTPVGNVGDVMTLRRIE